MFISRDYGFKNDVLKIEKQKSYINYAFTFAFIWSVGANLKEVDKPKFDNNVRDKFASTFFPNAAKDVYDVYLSVQ